MSEILHDFPINASAARVFDAVSAPRGLDTWWTLRSEGEPVNGATYALDFGPDYQWTGRITACERARCFELELVDAMPDWVGTRVRFELTPLTDDSTQLRFSHSGWPEPTEHFRISSFCWAMYLRVMRRGLEYGEVVPYDRRLEV